MTQASMIAKADIRITTHPQGKTDPESLLAFYCDVCSVEEIVDLKDVVTLFSCAANDYLDGKLDDAAFGSFSFGLYTARVVIKLLKHEHPELLGLLNGCVDIAWLAEEGKHLDTFKNEIRQTLDNLQTLRDT